MKKQAGRLTSLRQKAASVVERQMKEKLIPLGIPNVQFKVELTPKEVPDETGTDKINFLFSANKTASCNLSPKWHRGVKSRASCSR